MIILFLTGCKNQMESVITIQATINGEVVDQVALSLNSLMGYEFTVQSSGKVGRMELIKNVNGVNTNISVVGFANGANEKVAGSVEVTSDMQLTLVVYDKNKISTSKTILIEIFVKTNEVTDITLTSAKTGGAVADAGGVISARGVCWSTLPNPTIETSPKSNDGVGTGEFISEMKNLSPATTYYVRSYAIGSQGVLYGNEQIFSTLIPPVPTVPNGGFEDPVIASGFLRRPTPNVWTFVGTGAGIQKNGSAFGAKTAPEGVQTALFQNGGVAIFQTIEFTEGYFALSFMAAQRGTQAQTFEVYFDDTLIGKLQPASADFEYFVSDTFFATAGPHKITIKGTNGHGGGNAGFIDDVKLEYRNKP